MPSKMAEIVTIHRVLWALAFLMNAALIALLFYRRNYRVFPFFFLYALLNILQGVVLFLTYRLWALSSAVSFKTAWGTQTLVVTVRALAVAEVCRRVLAKYRGIWALGWRIFLAIAMLVLVYSLAAGRHSWQLVIVTADRSLELAMAAAVLGLFVFMRYYEVIIEPAARLLAIGFFLYSCFRVLNDTILERWLMPYATLWNLLGTVAFLASLLVWVWALRYTQSKMTLDPELYSENHYRSLSPEINTRLKTLNEQLRHFWYAEGRKT